MTDTVIPHSLASLPPSPSSESEETSRSLPWLESAASQTVLQRKDKRRETEQADSGDEASEFNGTDASIYPPDNAETRRVEENLRKWEIAERQRRKAARESTLHTPDTSVVGDVSRRASSFWRKSNYSSRDGQSKHIALETEEHADSLPLEEITTPDISLTPTEQDLAHSLDNPFEPVSPFADSNAVVSSTRRHADALSDSHPTSSFPSKPSPPQPLGLPPPRSPPPINKSPQPVSDPIATALLHSEEDLKETRWWHEWLCGCGEGPDRGGDNQAGRTNPFE